MGVCRKSKKKEDKEIDAIVLASGNVGPDILHTMGGSYKLGGYQ